MVYGWYIHNKDIYRYLYTYIYIMISVVFLGWNSISKTVSPFWGSKELVIKSADPSIGIAVLGTGTEVCPVMIRHSLSSCGSEDPNGYGSLSTNECLWLFRWDYTVHIYGVWLVVYHGIPMVVWTYPSAKYVFVSWDDDIPIYYIWKKHVPNHQPGVISVTKTTAILGHNCTQKWMKLHG